MKNRMSSRITRTKKRKNVIGVIKSLQKPLVEKPGDMRGTYYEERKKKYGF